MKRKNLFLSVIALCMTMALSTTALADGLKTTPEIKNRKTFPYPRATKAIPASAMEFDSVADCFVVRDTIFDTASRAGARSGAAAKVVTRAAWGYWEDGVAYSYFGNQLSSDDMDEMKLLLAPWAAEFKNLDIDGILSPAPGKETWYMQITAVDNDDIDDADGELRIYNDIGTSYNYKTIAIDSTALRGNEYSQPQNRIIFR